MSADSYRILILSEQLQERETYRKYLADSLDASFHIDDMNSAELEQDLSPTIADCLLVVQSHPETEPMLVNRLFLTEAPEDAPGVVFVVHPEALSTQSLQASPRIEFITSDEASPYRLVHAVQRLIERREILKRIEEYAASLMDAQEILDQLWDDIVGPALIFDIQGVVKRVNAPFLKLTQETPDNFIGRGCVDFLPSMDEHLFQERLSSILGEGSGLFWSGQFDADRQPQYPLRFSAHVPGKKEKASRFMVLVEPELVELPVAAVEPATLMQHMEHTIQRYDTRMSEQAFYALLSQGVQAAISAQGVVAFSFDALAQQMLKQSFCGSLPTWMSEADSHSKDDYVFRHAISDRQLKVFKLAPVPGQTTAMLITVPLLFQQRVLGSLCLAFEHIRELSADEHSFLGLIGAWAAQMIEYRCQVSQQQRPAQASTTPAEFLRSRSDVLPAITHELRTPLTVLMGYVQLLQRRLRTGSILEERNLRALHTILDRAQRIDATLETLIELARIDMGSFSIISKPVNLSKLLRDVLMLLRRQTAHTLIFDGLDDAMVSGDEVRLRRVFTSIIHNAIVYSPISGVVMVLVQSMHDMIRVIVADEGEGIRSEHISDVFTRFSTVRSNQSTGGMGVSLYIAREIIEAHQGTISLISALGMGSQVVIELPQLE